MSDMPIPSASDHRPVQFHSVAHTQVSVGVEDSIWREDDASEPTAFRRHRTRWLIIGLVILVLGVGSYCVAAAALSRRDYCTSAFWSTPRRIHYCGRGYFPAGVVRGPASAFTSEVDPAAEPRWETVGHTFS